MGVHILTSMDTRAGPTGHGDRLHRQAEDQAARWRKVRKSTEKASQEALEAEFPDWQIWIVHRYIGGPVWCARLKNDHKLVLNELQPEYLAESIHYHPYRRPLHD